MKKYTFNFTGRKVAAIGQFQMFKNVVRYGRTIDEARIALYDEYEHISSLSIYCIEILRHHKRKQYEAFPTARFWVWWNNGWVKLSLKKRPGCPQCGGRLNQRFSGQPEAYCPECEIATTATFRDRLTCHKSYFNGEGWSWDAESYEYIYYRNTEAPYVLNDYGSGGSDCDGKHSSTGSRECPVDQLQSVSVLGYDFDKLDRDYFNNQPIIRPEWKKTGKEEVYDQYAQMAGY